MTHALVLLIAMVLDAIFGEPRVLWSRLPHPAVLMGRAVALADRWLNTGRFRRARGILALAVLAGGTGAIAAIAGNLPGGPVIEIALAAMLLAQRSLAQHVAAVAIALRRSPAEGRIAVAMIVGRDTAAMDGPGIARGAIESGAENLSDGVIAPAFWFLLAGLPGIAVYKMVNTADSMVGYRTPRHEAFGWAAARLDDLLNLIPARLTALMILTVHGRPGLWRSVARDARPHRSPNAGWPEAAMARCLDVALSGPRSYDGEMRDFPWVHPDGDRSPGPEAIRASVRMLWRVWTLAFALTAVVALAALV